MTFKELRNRVNLTCAEVATLIGIQESSYRKYECSSRVPKLNTLVKLKYIFKCTDIEIMQAICYHTEKRKSMS